MKAVVALFLVGVALPAQAQQMDDAEVPPRPVMLPRYDGVPRDQPSVPVTMPSPQLELAVPPPLIAPPPPIAAWSPDDPRGYTLVRNRGLMFAGIGIFSGSWFLTAMGAAFAGGYLAIPIAGPIITTARDGGFSNPMAAGAATLAVLDSAAQLAGLMLAIVGATTRHRVWNKRVAFAPLVGRDRAGATLAFHF
jgi:hypothetical protein